MSSTSNTSSSEALNTQVNLSSLPAHEQAAFFSEKLQQVKREIEKHVLGQAEVIEKVLLCILSGGHALLVGPPGLAKTRLVTSLGAILGLDHQRIQFTPDLMPSDIIGSEVIDEQEGKRYFRYIKGPIFTQLLMADEINRASPRTQSALLQAMQEFHVSVAGKNYNLPQPFHVLATQNPLEQEGTYPLPEAQLDRFLLQINITYPDAETEKQIILNTTGAKKEQFTTILNAQLLQQIQSFVRQMPLGENVLNAIVQLVRAARPKENEGNYIAWGAGPRAGQALALCIRARALYQGRLVPSIEDVKALALPALQHRLSLNFAALAENIRITDIIEDFLKDLA